MQTVIADADTRSPSLGMDGDGSRFVKTVRDDNVAEGAIKSGHLDHVEALICPVDVPYATQQHHHAKHKPSDNVTTNSVMSMKHRRRYPCT